MKRNLFIALAMMASSAMAANGNLGMDARIGYLQNDNDFDKTGEAKETAFKAERFRLRSAGNLSETFSYNFHLNMLKTSTAPNESDASSFIDLFMLHHQLTPELKLSFGKFITFLGGREWDYNGADQYQYSYFGWNNAPANRVGVQASYKWMGQDFVLQVANGDESTQNRQQSYWIGWNGNLMEGKILPIIAYGLQKHGTADNGENQTSTYITAGARFNIKSVQLETDYLSYCGEDATTVNKKDETTAMIIQARYMGEKFRPLFKYSNDSVKISGEKAGTVDRMTAALEYYPDAALNYRYHLAYTTDKADPKSGNTDFDYSKSSIILGIRANLDIIKF